MSQSDSPYKFASKLPLVAAVVVGGFLAAPLLPKPALRVEPQTMQFTNPDSAVPELPENVDRTAVLATAVAGAAAIGLGLSAIDSRNRSARFSTGSKTAGSKKAVRSVSGSVTSVDQTSRKLQRRLMSLLHDDRGAANRLMAQVELKYPGKHADWYAEKVIYDLTRDRGAY
jgi:hypothetical protein